MKLNSFLQLIGALFVFKAIFGLGYLVLGWQATFAGMPIPMSLVLAATIIDAVLAIMAFQLIKK